MPTITRSDFAKLAGVTRAAITQAVKRRTLASEADGTIDTELPLNARWLADKRAGIKGPHPPKPAAPPKKPPTPPQAPPGVVDTDDPEGDDTLGLMVEAQGEKLRLTRARRQQAEADTALKRIRESQLKRDLIPREVVRREQAQLDAALKTHLRDMPRRITAQIVALARSTGEPEVEAYLEREISAALTAALGKS